MATAWNVIGVIVALIVMGCLLVYGMAQSARKPSAPINTAPIDADFDEKKKQEAEHITKASQEELLARLNDDFNGR